MGAGRVPTSEIVRIAAISLLVVGAAFLLARILIEVSTILHWVFAAIFLTLAMHPAVDLMESLGSGRPILPRWLAILLVYIAAAALFIFIVLHVIHPIVQEVEALAPQLPTYVKDFEHWAEGNEQFRELNDKYDVTKTLSDQASQLPSKLGGAAQEAGTITVSVMEHVLAAITVLALTFFLLLDGRPQSERLLDRLPSTTAERWRRVGLGIYRAVKGYVSVNLVLAAAAGVFTWLVLELLGVPFAVPLGVLVAFLDLVPLIGLTAGGVVVAAVVAFHDFPGALIIWAALFLTYQQVQDRVVQPLLYKNAVNVHPAVAIVAILIGGTVLGVLGALLAIPVAASIGVVIGEVMRWRDEREGGGVQPELTP